jgi:ribosome-binding protein aMBF1 (putative translation factor)
MGRCLGIQAKLDAQREAVDMSDVVAARKVKGWSQEDLALHLKLPKSTVGKAERGQVLCPQEIVDWLDSQ